MLYVAFHFVNTSKCKPFVLFIPTILAQSSNLHILLFDPLRYFIVFRILIAKSSITFNHSWTIRFNIWAPQRTWKKIPSYNNKPPSLSFFFMKFWQLSLSDALSKVMKNIFFSIPYSFKKFKIFFDKRIPMYGGGIWQKFKMMFLNS